MEEIAAIRDIQGTAVLYWGTMLNLKLEKL